MKGRPEDFGALFLFFFAYVKKKHYLCTQIHTGL